MGWWTDTVNWSGDRLNDLQDFSTNRWNDVTGVTASKKAADAQQQAAREANSVQLQMFNKTREDQAPFLKVGQESINRLADLYNSGAFNQSYGPQFEFGEFQGGDQPRLNDPGAYAGAGPAPAAFKFDPASLQNDPGVQFRLEAANKALERSSSARGAGLGGGKLRALSELNQGLASQEYGNAYGRSLGEWDRGRQSYENDRTFGSNLNALNRTFALQSYGAQSDQYNQNRNAFNQNQLSKYGIYNDSRNEFYQNQGNQFNRLASLAGLGQGSANSLGGQSGQLGQSLGNNIMAGANAQAAGIVGGYNSQRDTAMGLGKMIASYYGGKS
jgi:hypothetical protein